MGRAVTGANRGDRELSFTKAAAKLHLAQPSLTRQFQDLEEEIGVRLPSTPQEGKRWRIPIICR